MTTNEVEPSLPVVVDIAWVAAAREVVEGVPKRRSKPGWAECFE